MLQRSTCMECASTSRSPPTAGAVMLLLKTDKHHTGCGGSGGTVYERWSSSMREESSAHVFCFAAQAGKAVHCHHVLSPPAAQTMIRAAILVSCMKNH